MHFSTTDRGWRLDLLLVSDALESRVLAAAIDRNERAKPSCSDHAPVWLDIAGPSAEGGVGIVTG